MRKDISKTWLANKFVAHRGLHNDIYPENSLGAFNEAIKQNYAFEMDVQMSKDGVLIVHHDRSLKRMTGLDKYIDEIDAKEITCLKLGQSNEHVPTMQEMLDLVAGNTPILIEIKDHANIGVLEQKLTDMLHNYVGEFAVQSFNPRIVKWFKINAPEFIRGQLSYSFKKDKGVKWFLRPLLRHLFFIKFNSSEFVTYDVCDIHRHQFKRLKKKMPILMWTTRSKEQMDKNKDYFTNVIFENFIPE